MPWAPGDASKHKKGLSPTQSRKWSHVANSVLQKTGDEARAVRAANSVTRGSVQRRLRRRAEQQRGRPTG